MDNMQDPAVTFGTGLRFRDPRHRKTGRGQATSCLFLVIVLLNVFLRSYGHRPVRTFQAYPRFQVIFWATLAIWVGIMIFGLIAAAKLYWLKLDAPRFAKTFCLTVAGYSIADTFLILLAGLPASVNKRLIEGMPRRVLPLVVLAVAEYSSLALSKKVREAYGGVGAEPTVPEESVPQQAVPGEQDRPRKSVACPQCRQSENVPSDRIYDPGQYKRFAATAKRRFGFLTLKLTCRSCGKQFTYDGDS